jgi:hypothetical protein
MRRLFLGIVASSLLACGGDSTGPNASAVGTWSLELINGHVLPFTVVFIASPVYRLEIVSDIFVASSNGTYVETTSVRETDGSSVTTQTETDVGTWTQNNSALTITASDGTVSSAAISGNIITASESGDVLIYRRQ